MRHALFESFVRCVTKVLLWRHALPIDLWRGKVRQLGFAQNQGQVAAFGNFQRIGNCRWNIRKQLQHLRAGLKVLLTCKAPYPFRVTQNFAIGNTNACFVGFKIIRIGELHRMCCHHGQFNSCGQLHCCIHMRYIVRSPCALQLDIKTMCKNTG